jgi:hypothetical protein
MTPNRNGGIRWHTRWVYFGPLRLGRFHERTLTIEDGLGRQYRTHSVRVRAEHATLARPRRQHRVAARYTKVLPQPLRAPDEGAHQRGAFGRMGLKQEMRAVKDVRLHAGERLHPGEGLLEVEEDIVPPP